MELKIDKKFIDEAVQKAIDEIKENYIWIPKEGMTNEEVMKAVFGKSYADIDSYIYGSKDVEVKQWCRSPYKGVSE